MAVATPRKTPAPSPSSFLTRARLGLFTACLAVLGYGVMSFGAYVRSTESGMGCPDWPVCHSKLVAPGFHAMNEEIHRWLVGALSIGVVLIAVALLSNRDYRADRRLTTPLKWVLGMLVVQVLMGAITVWLNNIAWTVAVHFGAAALLVGAIALLAVRLLVPSSVPRVKDGYSRMIGLFALVTLLLLMWGAMVANTDSHTACGQGYPLCNGQLFPGLNHHTVINYSHRIWAGVMLLWAFYVFVRTRRERVQAPALVKSAAAVVALYVLLGFAGFLVVNLGENTAGEVFHSSAASLSWLSVAVLWALTRTLPVRAEQPV